MNTKIKTSRLTVKQARKALGMIARNYTDEQIQEITDTMRAIAELAYDDLSRSQMD